MHKTTPALPSDRSGRAAVAPAWSGSPSPLVNRVRVGKCLGVTCTDESEPAGPDDPCVLDDDVQPVWAAGIVPV